MRRILLILFCVVFLPGLAAAQKAHPAAETNLVRVRPIGISLARTLSGSELTGVRAVADRPRAGQDVALMAVGAGAMVAGAVVDGDAGKLFLVAGAVIGLIGLYHHYLR